MHRLPLNLLLAAVVTAHLLLAGWFALHRPIDGDEGYYGLAARLVSEGQRPYDDFFYPQSPLLPYLYAPAAGLVGAPQLPELRLWSVLLGTLAVALLAGWTRRAHGARPAVAVVALLLIALSPELLTWLTTVKTYAATALALAAGILATQRAAMSGRHRWLWALLGGTAVGLGASTRLLLAPAALMPAMAWLLWPGPRRPAVAAAWLVGVIVGCLPLLVPLLHDADRFWFNNVGYHQLRFSTLEDASWPIRAWDAVQTMLLAILTNPGLLLMAVLALLGLRRPRPDLPRDASVGPATLMAVAYLLTCLVPDPSYGQYFTGVLPVLLLPAAAAGLARLASARASALPVTAAATALALVLSLTTIRHDLAAEPRWQLDHYRDVCQRLSRGTSSGDTVFAFWSGYPAGAGRQPLPGMENHFGLGVSERLNPVQRRRYRIAGLEDLTRAFRAQEPAVAVIGGWMYEVNTSLSNARKTTLLDQFVQHYQLVDELGAVGICQPIPEPQR